MAALTKMKNETRNLNNIHKLAPHTQMAALDWYNAVKKAGIEVLVYETTRTLQQQKDNVQSGASQTMKSYHLVGQALDFVLVDQNNKALWNGYTSANGKKVIDLALKFGFEWGGNWPKFKDQPHLQFTYKGYGKDYIPYTGVLKVGVKSETVKDIQNFLNVSIDGSFGPATEQAVKNFQKSVGLKPDGIVGPQTFKKMFPNQ